MDSLTSRPLRLAVIVGSNREGRFGPTVARWVVERAEDHGGFEIDVLDVAELGLPLVHPARPDANVLALRERLDAADAFVIVTPEYNHSYPAAVKLLLDLAKREWARKAAGFVSYGGLSGGLRAVEALRPVIGAFDLHGVADTVSLHMASRAFGEDGRPLDPESDAALDRQLAQLRWWGTALRSARDAEREVAAAVAA